MNELLDKIDELIREVRQASASDRYLDAEGVASLLNYLTDARKCSA